MSLTEDASPAELLGRVKFWRMK